MDDLNDLLRLDLPTIGPILLDTHLKITPKDYDLSTLRITVGRRRLAGSMALDTSRPQPHLDVKLVSERIQIDDFTTLKKMGPRKKPSAAQALPSQQKTEKGAAR